MTPPAGPLTISVLVPTYRRPQHLRRCLDALAKQRRSPAEVVLLVRDADEQSRSVLRGSRPPVPGLRSVTVSAPGVVAALNAGLAAARGDIVAITDDDAAPWPDWLERIERHFCADARIGGVGGRDWIPGFERATQRRVGIVQWWGRVIGNHHLGRGAPREVHVLKGVNMSFRRLALHGLRFDDRLLGEGAQVHNELGLCFTLRARGWRLIYDPEVAVDHNPGPRFDADQRDRFCARAVRDAVHNETLVLLEHLPGWRRAVFVPWAVAVGTRAAPGLAQWVRFLIIGGDHRTARLLASWQGRWDAWQTWRAGAAPLSPPVRKRAG